MCFQGGGWEAAVCLIFTTISQFMFTYIRKNLAGHSESPDTRVPSTVTKIGTEK